MADGADTEWRLIPPEVRSGPMNMALDEIAAKTAESGGPATLRVYSWDPSTLTLGYAQDPATIDWDYCEAEEITVTRRPTGGGAIYHDRVGDVSYSIVASQRDLPESPHECYEHLCTPLLSAIESLGLDAGFASEARPAVHEPICYLRALDPAHDVVAPDGRKLSGNAQYRRRGSVVQHGSLTFARDAERHLAAFDDASITPGTFRDRVTSISEQADRSRPETVAALTDALEAWADATVGDWTDAELADARDLAAAKYASTAWTREGTDPETGAESAEHLGC
jgi:lipoate-protein ligase A